MAKNGNFVGRKDIPFDNDQIADILALKCGILEIFKGRDASVLFKQNQPSDHYFDDKSPDYAKMMQTVFTVDVKPDPNYNGYSQRSGKTLAKRRLSSNTPRIGIVFRNRVGIDEVTGEDCSQFSVSVTLFGFQEKGYRKQTWHVYEPSNHYGYGDDINEMWNDTVKPCLEQIFNDFNLLIE